MTVLELIEELGFLNPDAEVRLATQPSWPLEHNIRGIVEVEDEEERLVVYLGEGRQIGYLPGEAADALGWG